MNEIQKKRIEEAADDLLLHEMPSYYEAFVKGAEYAFSHQWISIEEALPEVNKEVFVLFPDGTASVAVRHKTFNANGGDVIVWKNGDYTYDDSWIRFWMPIPKLKM